MPRSDSIALICLLGLTLILLVHGLLAIKDKHLRLPWRESYVTFKGTDAQAVGVICVISALVVGGRIALSLLDAPQNLINNYQNTIVVAITVCVIIGTIRVTWMVAVRIIALAISYGRYLGRVYKIPIAQDEPPHWGNRKRKEKLDEPDEL